MVPTSAGAATNQLLKCQNLHGKQTLSPRLTAVPGMSAAAFGADLTATGATCTTEPAGTAVGLPNVGGFLSLAGKVSGGPAACGSAAGQYPQAGTLTMKYTNIDPATSLPYQSTMFVRNGHGTDPLLPEEVTYTGIVTKGVGVAADVKGSLLVDPLLAKRPSTALYPGYAFNATGWAWWPKMIVPPTVDGANNNPSQTGPAGGVTLDSAITGLQCQNGANNLFDGFAWTAPRTVTDGVTNSGSAVVTSATGNFTANDMGATIKGAGIPAGAVIVNIPNATTVVMNQNATATATGVSVTIGGQPYKQSGVTKAQWEGSFGPGTWPYGAAATGDYYWSNGFPIYPDDVVSPPKSALNPSGTKLPTVGGLYYRTQGPGLYALLGYPALLSPDQATGRGGIYFSLPS